MEQVDRDILDWIAAHSNDDALAAQIVAARVKRRDGTRTGFFVYFEPGTGERTGDGLRPVCPRLTSAGLMDGAGCDLFLRDGQLHYLEVYARGGFLPEPLTDYRLVPES